MSSERLIQVDDMGFTYPGARTRTLDGLDFSVAAGEIYGFLGPSGAGKSTTQKILYRLVQGYSGSVRLFGKEIRDWDTSVYEHMGIGFETANLYDKLTGRENLQFSLSMRRRAAVAMEELEAAAVRIGLGEALDDRTETYSKGMRMRLAFLRAVLHRPRLLFLDEPTSGLDPLWAREIKDWILEIRRQGTAVFITTHSMELADELCDTVGFLVDGRLMLQESPAELKRRYGRPGVIVSGRTESGEVLETELSYERLLSGLRSELCEITRVANREVSLEQVFLTVTGRDLRGGPHES